jgi:hypothetical protein
MLDTSTMDSHREIVPIGGFTWQIRNIMSILEMRFVSFSKATMCTKTLIDWNMIGSDHAGVRIWSDICKNIPENLDCSK